MKNPHLQCNALRNLTEFVRLKVLIESSHEEVLVNELVGIYASEVKPKAQLAAAHALCLAVDRCRDMIHVTDAEHIVMVPPISIRNDFFIYSGGRVF